MSQKMFAIQIISTPIYIASLHVIVLDSNTYLDNSFNLHLYDAHPTTHTHSFDFNKYTINGLMPIFFISIYTYIYETLNNIRVWILIIMKLNPHIVYIFYICQNNIASKSTACEMHVTERKQKDGCALR